MTVSAHLNVFCGKTVEDYDPQEGILDPESRAYRISLSYDEYDKGKKIEELVQAFAIDAKAAEVEDLIIGAFDFESSQDTSSLVQSLVQLKDQFPKLKNLFIGDITSEECEISWIQQGDVSPIFESYPDLRHFQVRGGTGLSLGKLTHENLESLIVETGGLPPNVIKEVNEANLPNLKHLELWLGSDDYGFGSGVEDLQPMLSAENFPKLTYLGLKDSVISDEIAKALQGAPVMEQIEVLDLSMGTLSDEGAQALYDNPAIGRLKHLNLAHHYMSDEMMDKLKQLRLSVNVAGQNEEEEEYGRFVEVAE